MSLPEIKITTSVGKSSSSQYWYQGFPIVGDLAGKESFTGLLAMAVVRRRLSSDECALLDDVAAVSSSGDARVWPLKVARLISSYGGTLPGFCAGQLGLEEALIGPWPTGMAAQFLFDFNAALGNAPLTVQSAEEVLERSFPVGTRLYGFGVPFREHDERLTALRQCIAMRRREGLRYWRLLNVLSEAVRKTRKLEPNLLGGLAAALLDIKMTPHEIATMCTMLFTHLFAAHAVEGANECNHWLRELPWECVNYVGSEPTVSPRAQ